MIPDGLEEGEFQWGTAVAASHGGKLMQQRLVLNLSASISPVMVLQKVGGTGSN